MWTRDSAAMQTQHWHTRIHFNTSWLMSSSLLLLRLILCSLCWVSVTPMSPVLGSWWVLWHWKRYSQIIFFFSLSTCFSSPLLVGCSNVAWQPAVMISCWCCGQFCHRLYHFFTLWFMWLFHLLPSAHISGTCLFALCLGSVCGWIFPFFPPSVTESYRGLDAKWGEASSPSGQFQRC